MNQNHDPQQYQDPKHCFQQTRSPFPALSRAVPEAIGTHSTSVWTPAAGISAHPCETLAHHVPVHFHYLTGTPRVGTPRFARSANSGLWLLGLLVPDACRT